MRHRDETAATATAIDAADRRADRPPAPWHSRRLADIFGTATNGMAGV